MKRKHALESELELIRSQKAQVLRAIQLIAKKQKVGAVATQTSLEAKAEAEKRYHAEAKKRIWQNCSRIISELLKNNSTRTYFGEPVRGDLYPGYYETIKNPRDLGTIKKQLESHTHFKTVYEFRDDVRLCFENCRSFNPQGHPVRNFGDAASNQFEKKWEAKRVEEEWESEMKRHDLAVKRLEAEAKSLPEKMKEVDEELQALASKAFERTEPKAAGPGRAMSFEEKRKLSHLITHNISGEQMTRVLDIIVSAPTAPVSDAADKEEIEIDIDSLDNDTLWKIQGYIDTLNLELLNKAVPAQPVVGETMTATGETPTVDSHQEQGGEAQGDGRLFVDHVFT